MYQPYPGADQMPETHRPPVPAAVRSAARVMYAGAAASLLYMIVDIATLSTTKASLARRFAHLAAPQINRLTPTLIAGAIAGGVIGAALWIIIARACLSGRNWARVTGTVLFGIATIEVAAGLIMPLAAPVKIVEAVIWLAGLAAVVLLWQPSSSAFFGAARP